MIGVGFSDCGLENQMTDESEFSNDITMTRVGRAANPRALRPRLTGADQLALIPRAFNQRLADCTEDSAISITLERELEEGSWFGLSLKRSHLGATTRGIRRVDLRRCGFVERRRERYWTIGIAVAFEPSWMVRHC
jgi:hypothetical protein